MPDYIYFWIDDVGCIISQEFQTEEDATLWLNHYRQS
jgi:hypothetical protein